MSKQDCVSDFVALAERDAREEGASALADRDVVAVMTAAVRLYARRAENAGGVAAPPIDVAAVSATEVLTAACEMLRAINVNMFDVQLWFSRGQN